MKKILTLTTAVLATLALSATVFAQDISVNLNGKIVNFPNQKPVVVDGRTLIPLRGVFDNMGYGIDWSGETKTVTLKKGSDTITVSIGESCYYLNGTSHQIDVPAQIINGSTMLPLRAIADATGSEVLWDGETKMVTIVDSSAIDLTPQYGVTTVTSQTEADYVKGYTALVEYYNKSALQYITEINSMTVQTEEDLAKMGAVASNYQKLSADTLANIKKLNAPAKYADLQKVTLEYLQLNSDFAQICVDVTNGTIDFDKFNSQYQTVGTNLMLKEQEYQAAFNKIFK